MEKPPLQTEAPSTRACLCYYKPRTDLYGARKQCDPGACWLSSPADSEMERQMQRPRRETDLLTDEILQWSSLVCDSSLALPLPRSSPILVHLSRLLSRLLPATDPPIPRFLWFSPSLLSRAMCVFSLLTTPLYFLPLFPDSHKVNADRKGKT